MSDELSPLPKQRRFHVMGSWFQRPSFFGIPRFYHLLVVFLFTACSVIYFTQDLTHYNTAAITAHGDGRYYYVYLRSLAFDRDVDFKNDYVLLGNPYGFKKTKTGRSQNKFTIGPAIFWAPFMAIAHTTLAVKNAIGITSVPLDGTSKKYQTIVFFGSLFWGLASLFVFFLISKPYGKSMNAAVASIAILLATPLLWFSIRQASFSHATSAFSTAVFVLYWHRTLLSRTRKQWFILGILLGLAALVRPQNAAHVIVALGEWIFLFQRTISNRSREGTKNLFISGFIFLGGFLIAFSPQMIAWQSLYGSPFVIPQGKSFMHWTASRWEAVLFSSRAGLLAWHPIITFALIGLFILALRRQRSDQRPHERLVAIVMLSAFAVQVYLNGAAWDWFGGWAFGGRRFLSCSVYFALGLAVFFETVIHLLTRIGRYILIATPLLLLLLFSGFNLGLMDGYLKGRVRHGSSQPMGPLWRDIIDRAYAKAYRHTGNLGSAPANWIFALRAGTHAENYDQVSGLQVLEDNKASTLAFSRADVAFSGFGDPTTYEGQSCRIITKTHGTFVIGLRDPSTFFGLLTLRAASPAATVTIRLQGKIVLQTSVERAWVSYPFFVPRALTTSGLNYFDVTQTYEELSPRRVGKAKTLTPIELTVESAGFAYGRRALFVLGRKKVVEKRRGIVVFAAKPGELHVSLQGVFDTYGRTDASQRFYKTLNHLPKGSLVALAVVDEASRKWGADADKALNLIGAKTSLKKRYRCSYAAIGVRGAQPGTALETISCKGKARLRLGRPLAQRLSGTAWSKLHLTPITP